MKNGQDGQRSVAFMDEGKLKVLNADKDFADMLLYAPETNGVIMEAMRKMGGIGRELFINKQPGFWLFNFFRDFYQTTKNLPGTVLNAGLTKYYLKGLGQAANYHFRGKVSDPLRAAISEDVMLSGGPHTKRNYDGTDSTLEALFEQYGVGPRGGTGGLRRWIGSASRGVNKVMETMETGMKLAAYEYLKTTKIPQSYVDGVTKNYKRHFIQDGTDKKGRPVYKIGRSFARYLNRTMSGTSDIVSGGTNTAIANHTFQFANSKVQGMYSTVEAFQMNPSMYMKRLAARDAGFGAVTAALATGTLSAIALNWFGASEEEVRVIKKLEALYAAIPEHHLAGFEVIPWGVSEGRVVYSRVPKSYEGQAIRAGFFHLSKATLLALRQDFDDAQKSASAVGESVILDNNPFQMNSILPVLEVGWATLKLGFNKGHKDFWHERQVTRRADTIDGRLEEAKKLLRWAYGKIGFDIYLDWDVLTGQGLDPNGDRHEIDKLRKIPGGVGEVIGRAVRVGGEVEDESPKK